MLKFKVKEMLESSGIEHPGKWLIRFCDFSKSKAYKILNNKQKSIDLQDFSKLCENLNCTPNDLMYWHTNSRTRIQPTHPCLTQLSTPPKTANWFKIFKSMTADKINALQKQVLEDIEKK